MKNLKNTISLLIVLVAVVGCKDEKKGGESKEAAPSGEPTTQIVLDAVVKKNDAFDLFYNEDESMQFDTKRVRTDITGKPESQEIIFNLPENNIHLTNLRLDVGDNQEQEEMTINKLIIRHGDKEIEISGEDFFKQFMSNNFIKDIKGKTFTTQKGEGYDPLFYGNANLMNSLKSLGK